MRYMFLVILFEEVVNNLGDYYLNLYFFYQNYKRDEGFLNSQGAS